MAGELDLAGRSERDQAVREFVRSHLVRSPGTPSALPTVLLLGPRGSGKTTLLSHLADWAASAPVAHLDLAALGQHGGKPIDVLARLVFDLNARKPDFPRLTFPTFAVLLIAVSTTVDLVSREHAVQQVQEALDASGGVEGKQIQRVVQTLAEAAAGAFGAPDWAVTAALRLLPGWEDDWAGLSTRRRLARIRRQRGAGPVDDFLVSLNRLYNDHERAERQRAEESLFDAFLSDLQRAYSTRRNERKRTTHCLLLLDNADSPLGNDFAEALLRAREKTGLRDPLVVLATAASRPEVLMRREPGGVPHPGAYLACWDRARRFEPVRVDDVLQAGQLRDLHRREVNQEAELVLRAVPSGGVMPEADDGVRWLGWFVHQLTHGQPAATAAVLEALRHHRADEPWDVRMRLLFTRELVAGMLDRLLPLGTSPELRRMLRRAAVAVNLGQAGAAPALWRAASEALGSEFARFSGDPLRTMHLSTGDEPTDGVHETLHPVLRFLLLRELATEEPEEHGESGSGESGESGEGGESGEPGAGAADPAGDDAVHAGDPWEAAHAALRERAAARVAEGHDEAWSVAYHDLAAGDLERAAVYLDGRIGTVPASVWCTELCRLRRAPVRTPRGALPGPPRRGFEELVSFLGEPGRHPGKRMKAVTRLLAASWISPEPRDDEATDRVGDPYRNPLGAPYAELYPDIRGEFLALRGMVDDEADRHVLLQKSDQYERRPWW